MKRIPGKILIINLIIAAFTVGFSQSLFSQIKGLSESEDGDIISESMQEPQTQLDQLLGEEKFPAANKVIAENYYIGPGDVLSIQILPMLTAEQPLIVSPEGNVIIPRIGLIELQGKTLAEAKMIIEDSVKKRNPNAELSLTLRKSRIVMVNIEGNVLHGGTYNLPASYSVSSLIRLANRIIPGNNVNLTKADALLRMEDEQRLTEQEYSSSGVPSETEFSSRNIKVIHNDGTSQNVDLEKARALDAPEFDPYLREGDVIKVPYGNKKNFPKITISGAVIRPVSVVYKHGDKASMLLKMGAGLDDEANLDNVYLVTSDGEKKELKINKSMELLSQDHDLNPGNLIIVGRKKQKDGTENGVVSVKGEVLNPGVYPIIPKQTRLKEIIEEAGGLTDEAHLPLAYIIRHDNRELSTVNSSRDFMEYFHYSDLSLEDTIRFQLDMKLMKPMVSCDFEAALEGGSNNENVYLDHGDVINIPEKPDYVYVFGQVKRPGYVRYTPGKRIDWYIAEAGGATKHSEPERARIITGKNRIWMEDRIVKAGEQVYVPSPPDLPKQVEAQQLSIYTSIALGIVSIAGLITNIIINISRN